MKRILFISFILLSGCMPFSSQVAKDHIMSIAARQNENATQWNSLVQQLALENKNVQLESNNILFAQGDAILQELEALGFPQEEIDTRRTKLYESYTYNNNRIEMEYNRVLETSENLVRINQILVQEMLDIVGKPKEGF